MRDVGQSPVGLRKVAQAQVPVDTGDFAGPLRAVLPPLQLSGAQRAAQLARLDQQRLGLLDHCHHYGIYQRIFQFSGHDVHAKVSNKLCENFCVFVVKRSGKLLCVL